MKDERELEPLEPNEMEVELDEADFEDAETDGEVEILDAPQQNDFETKYKETLDRYQRTLAEFDNFRKRTIKEMAGRYDDGVRSTCEKLLPIIDNFERALNAHENKEDTFYQGIALIARQFDSTLEELGVKPMELEVGDDFNPNLHNAVAHIEDENFGQNAVADILQKGYIHKDKVIRHSMVRVAN